MSLIISTVFSDCVESMKNTTSWSSEFPEINADVAENIDIKTKAKVLTYQSDNVNRDVSIVLQEEIKKCVKTKNFGKISKKCNKLAR